MFSAHAKINLGLRVLAKRPDGYHDIETVFHRISLHDLISFAPAPTLSLDVTGIDVPRDGTNLCLRAASLLADRCRSARGARIILEKRIPVGAGLGGGSADAALVLRELPRFWGVRLDRQTEETLALELGSDVPFFLGNGSAYARGRGEELDHFSLALPYAVLVVNPGIHVSTAWAYAHVTPQMRTGEQSLKELVISSLNDPRMLRENVVNDFEGPVFDRFPEIRQTKESMESAGARLALMSGSGSSVFGLFDDDEALRLSSAEFQRRGYTVSVTRPGLSI